MQKYIAFALLASAASLYFEKIIIKNKKGCRKKQPFLFFAMFIENQRF